MAEQTTTEFNLEKSTKVGMCINGMKFYLANMDLEYAKAIADRLDSDASTYHSAAVLIRSYDPVKGDLLELQAATLRSIVKLVENLKKCDELKKQVAKNAQPNDVEKMFGF